MNKANAVFPLFLLTVTAGSVAHFVLMGGSEDFPFGVRGVSLELSVKLLVRGLNVCVRV